MRKTAIAAALTLMLLAPSASEATETIGANLQTPPGVIRQDNGDGETFANDPMLPAQFQAGGGLTADAHGIITRWRLLAGDNGIFPVAAPTLRTLTRTGPLAASAGLSAPAPITLGPAGLYVFNTRIPIDAGQEIGLDYAPGMINQGLNIFFTPTLMTLTLDEDGVPAPANGTPYSWAIASIDAIDLNADIEPDADRDGFGDETQDLCPSNAAAQGACPVASAPARKKCKRKKKKHHAAAAKKKKKKCKRKKKK